MAGYDIQTLDTLMTAISFIVGAMVGSFLNVCVYRLPKGESVVKPRSRCPKCESSIVWYDNIPMVSWLMLGAKCRNCKTPISWQYPLVEAITAALFGAVYVRYGFTIASPVYMLLSAGLVLVTFVDLTDWTIPNEVTFPGIPLGLVCALVAMFVPGTNLMILAPPSVPIFSALLGAVVGGGILYALDKGALLILGKRGMGFGDVKLIAMLGAFFGFPAVVMIIAIAACCGAFLGYALILMQRSKGEEETAHYIPFGPYLSFAGVVVMLFGQYLYNLWITTMGIEILQQPY